MIVSVNVINKRGRDPVVRLDHFDIPRVLKTSLKNGGDFADIFCEQRHPTSIICEDGKIEKIISGIDVGAGLRTICNNKTAYAFTNRMTNGGLLEMADAVSCASQGALFEHDINLTRKEPEVNHAITRLPHDVSLDEKVALVKRADHVARSFDKRIKQVKVIYRDAIRQVAIANTKGELVYDRRVGTLFIVQVIAVEDDRIQTGYEPRGAFRGFELLQEHPPEQIAEIASRRALMMLAARRVPGGRMPVVLSSEAGGTMIHEAIGHGLEADLAQMGLSVFSHRIGETVASPLVTVVDDATLLNQRGSYAFDDEGVRAQRTTLVEKGVLKGYLYDYLTAMKDHTVSTGNGRRESYQSRPLPRMSNTFIAPGQMNPADVLHATREGLFVKKMGGGQVNTVNGDFVFEVTEGYLIEGGACGEPVRGATLTGNGPKVLMAIDMVGNDIGFGIGTCGKEGQGVPVADAQPTLRIPEIIVGGAV
jgi:TldD protein